ncbi:MAG: hypothetical protein JO252_23970 [Planctomycetaceae bacterium]|nr:hypothetical protein [Planctomycetaceae bacterium]
MVRYIACMAVFLLARVPLRAGELDAEFGAKAPNIPSAAPKIINPADAAQTPLVVLNRADGTDAGKRSELDAEAPAQAWRHCGWGYGRGFGWGGWGYGRGFGWGGWGGYGPGWGGWGGWGGYGPGWGRWGGYGPGWGGWGGWGGFSPLLGCGYGWGFW